MASKTFLEKRVHNNEFITMMLLWRLELSYEKNIKTPHTNKEEVLLDFKTTACDVLLTIW